MTRISTILTSFSIAILALFVAAPTHAAFYSLSTNKTTPAVGEQFTITVSMDTETQTASGIDFVATYNNQTFRIDSVSFDSKFPIHFESLQHTQGSFSLSALTATVGVTGASVPVATISATMLSTGQSPLLIACDPSGIWQKNGHGTDLLNCAKNQPITIGGASPTTSPTATPTASPTVSPTTSPTTSPTATPYDSCTITKPGIPTSMSATAGTIPGTISVQWNAVANATNYIVSYGIDSKKYTNSLVVNGTTTSTTIANLNQSTTYYIALFVLNGCATSDVSPEVYTKPKAVGTTATPSALPSSGQASPTPTPLATPEIMYVIPESSVSARPSATATPLSMIGFEESPSPEPTTDNQQLTTKSRFLLFFLGAAILLFCIIYILTRGKGSPPIPKMTNHTPHRPPESVFTPPEPVNQFTSESFGHYAQGEPDNQYPRHGEPIR